MVKKFTRNHEGGSYIKAAAAVEDITLTFNELTKIICLDKLNFGVGSLLSKYEWLKQCEWSNWSENIHRHM